ncbi:MAG: glycoside hydrolase family 3 protein [Bacillus sp. (in: firmicutes)]
MKSRRLTIFLISLMAFFLASCKSENPEIEQKPKVQENEKRIMETLPETVQKANESFIILQNVPEFPVSSPSEQVILEAIKIDEDGAAITKQVKWSSTNPEVVTIDHDGRALPGEKSGRTWLLAKSGQGVDYIGAEVDEEGKVSLLQEKDEHYQLVDRIMEGMTLEEKLGQLIIADFSESNGANSPSERTAVFEQKMKKYGIGGIFLPNDSLVSVEQGIKLTEQLQSASGKLGLFLSADVEEGAANRLATSTNLDNLMLGAIRSAALTKKAGKMRGTELRSVGVNLDYFPSLDIWKESGNQGISQHSFGDNPSTVVSTGLQVMKGMAEEGVTAAVGSFPGNGGAKIDKETGLSIVSQEAEELEETSITPYKEAIKAGAEAITLSNAAYPKLDPSTHISRLTEAEVTVPASLSPYIIQVLLREGMQFDGVVIADTIHLGAIAEHYGQMEAIIRTIVSGSDMVLVSGDLDDIMPSLIETVKKGVITEARLEEASRRIITLKVKTGLLKQEEADPVKEKIGNAIEMVGSPEHTLIEKEVARQSVTLVKNKKVLPLSELEEGSRIVVLGHEYVDELGKEVRSKYSGTIIIDWKDQAILTAEQEELVQEADYIIVTTSSEKKNIRAPDSPQNDLIKRVMGSAGGPVIAVAIQSPYDLLSYSEVNAYIIQYGSDQANFAAVADILFGDLSPQGKLPVAIPDGNGGTLFNEGHGLSY